MANRCDTARAGADVLLTRKKSSQKERKDGESSGERGTEEFMIVTTFVDEGECTEELRLSVLTMNMRIFVIRGLLSRLMLASP